MPKEMKVLSVKDLEADIFAPISEFLELDEAIRSDEMPQLRIKGMLQIF